MEEKVAFYWIGKPKTARASRLEPEIVCKTAVRVVLGLQVSLNTGIVQRRDERQRDDRLIGE
jgi:hypothetical protein